MSSFLTNSQLTVPGVSNFNISVSPARDIARHRNKLGYRTNLAMMPTYDNIWRTLPLGDFIETIRGPPQNEKGWARALENWNRLRPYLEDASALSCAQEVSLRILYEWWEAFTQAPTLSQAAITCIQESAGRSGADDDYLDINRSDCLLNKSTYHDCMFLLFQLEFVHESRILQKNNMEEFLGLLHAQREKCAQYASRQRVSNAFLDDTNKQPLSSEASLSRNTLLTRLDNCIAATVEPCPWLKVRETKERSPFYLWDVGQQRTIQVDLLPATPKFICITHTWGRWIDRKTGSATISGVPWDVPCNTRFHVTELPKTISIAFVSGYIWLDLFCIPQDRSVLALTEISRQAMIFSQADSVIAWLNDNETGWSCLQQSAKWLSLFYMVRSIDKEYIGSQNRTLAEYNDTADDFMELMIEVSNEPDAEDEFGPLGWFTSLWTLQEACLRPDLAICDKNWNLLATENGTVITLDCLVALVNFLTRKTYKSSVLKGLEEASVDLDDVIEDDLPLGVHDLITLLGQTFLDEIIWLSPSAVLTFGQFRECTSQRSEAIMSVIGATEWFTSQISEHGTVSVEENLVLGLYPATFLNEVVQKIGPSFYSAMHTNLGYLAGAVNIRHGEWVLDQKPKASGSTMPFTSSSTNMVPPQKYEFSTFNHPSVKEWEIQNDGSVVIRHAGFLTFENDEKVEKDNDDMLIAPNMGDGNIGSIEDIEIETLESQDLEDWLKKFSNPQSNPNFAVCLNQQIYLNQDIPGPQIGLLLKQVAKQGETIVMVKVGLFFTRSSRAWDISTKSVNWLVL